MSDAPGDGAVVGPHVPGADPADAPRVTLGIGTFNREKYLAEALESCLAQDYESLEVLVVDDGSTNPAIGEVLSGFEGDPRLRVVRHSENRGIAESYNTMVEEGRGELIAMLGDDDVCLPGRIGREVAIFDAHPDTGVVHGDALMIDGDGETIGRWDSRDFTRGGLIKAFFRSHNHLVDPTRMVHRRVYEAVGGYDGSFRVAQDMDFWLRAAVEFRFRHCPGGPLIGFRRHGENTSDESARAVEVENVERILEGAMERIPLRELVPELDWSVLDPREGERQALLRLADALERRALPLPGLAARVRERAREIPPASWPRPRVAHGPGSNPGSRSHPSPSVPTKKLIMTSFGWNDSGGGTTVPRLAAKELVRRGWDVTVFHAATGPSESGVPYEVLEWQEDGVRLLGIHNRAHKIWDHGHPLRELDDPPITQAFARALDQHRPDVVHFHNLHNLGAALMDEAATRGVASYFSTHNYWLVCPRAYLLTGAGEMCAGPGDGGRCASCVGSAEVEAHRVRLEGIRARARRGLTACLTVSEAVRRTLLGAGYPAEMLDVVRQGMPHDGEIWERVGRDRVPGRARPDHLTVAFLGSAYPHKGPQLLVQAAQRTAAQLRVEIHGEVPEGFAERLRGADERGVVELCGAFEPSEIEGVLAGVDVAALPSLWWDCAPLAAAECLAGRVPLLAPRLGGLGEAVEDGVNGLLFDALDVGDLARCLDRVAGEEGLLERLQGGIEQPRGFGDYIDDLEACYAGGRPGRVAAVAGSYQPAVRWQGDHGLSTSLSIVNGRVIERLVGDGVRVQRLTREGVALDGPLAHGADVEVRHQWPPDLSPPTSGRLAVIQPWEFGSIPREWVEPLAERVDELWVPSEMVREMYVSSGVDGERVVVIPNGVDLERFSPEGERYPLTLGDGGDLPEGATRFLFVGGLIWRKGPDVLLGAWREAFAGREDVVLVVKDVGVGGVYREGEREEMTAHAASGELPRVVLVQDELSDDQVAGLYRGCDVLVHPYRGEGFGMPVLEAMACGLPTIVTGGGPTDEFCPLEAGWRIASTRLEFTGDRVGAFDTVGRPWVLEPDVDHLAELLVAVASDPRERSTRGAAGRAAAESYGWDAVSARYGERIAALAAKPRIARTQPREFEEDVAVRVLATPAWRGEDRLGELLTEWSQATDAGTSACLYLLANPRVDGSQEELEARVLATGVELDGAGDITVLLAGPDEDLALHEGVDAYVPLHDACAGHARMARGAGKPVVILDGASLAGFLAEALAGTMAPSNA
jgi:glycosyltransferase involved in cell wall biosynthesis